MKDELFKGYVPTQNKKCTMRFKNASPDDLLSFEQVQNRSEYAGILAEDIILIDIDDSEQSEILLSIVDDLGLACRVYETSRGMHFFSGMFLILGTIMLRAAELELPWPAVLRQISSSDAEIHTQY